MVLYFRNGTAGTLFGNSSTASLYFGKGTNTTYFPRSPYTYFGGGGGSGPVYDPDAVILFAAMTVQPDTARKAVINQLILDLKAASIWSALDVLYVLAAHDAQAARLNWKAPASFALTAVNSPTFTIDRGYAGNGTSSYLNTGWDPATNGVNYTLNAAHVAAWNRTARASDTAGIIGNSSGGNISIWPRAFGGNLFARANDSSGGLANANSDGFFIANRSSSTARTATRNGTAVGSYGSVSSDGITTADVVILAITSASFFSTDQVAAASLGGSIAGLDSAYYTALQTYMTAVGA